MLRHILCTITFGAFLSFASAQQLDLFLFTGHTFGHRFPISGGSAKLFGGHTFGGSLSYNLNEYYAFEAIFSRQNSRATAFSPSSGLDVNAKMSSNFFLLGGNRLMPISEKAIFHAGMKLGTVIYAAKLNAFDPITKFAAGVGGGFRYIISDQLALRAQANLNFPITDVGANLWWSPGGGTSIGVQTYTPIVQFGFTGGIMLSLNR